MTSHPLRFAIAASMTSRLSLSSTHTISSSFQMASRLSLLQLTHTYHPQSLCSSSLFPTSTSMVPTLKLAPIPLSTETLAPSLMVMMDLPVASSSTFMVLSLVATRQVLHVTLLSPASVTTTSPRSLLRSLRRLSPLLLAQLSATAL